jgi:hypothetical protein
MANNSAPRIAPREGLLDEVKAALGEALIDATEAVGEVTLTVRRESIVEVCRTLRDRFEYQQLMEIAGVDYPQRPSGSRSIYHLLSVTEEPPHPGQAFDRRGHARPFDHLGLAGRRLARARGVRPLRRDLRRQ